MAKVAERHDDPNHPAAHGYQFTGDAVGRRQGAWLGLGPSRCQGAPFNAPCRQPGRMLECVLLRRVVYGRAALGAEVAVVVTAEQRVIGDGSPNCYGGERAT